MATASKRAEFFLGMHFFNPVPVMKLVELIRGHLTSDANYETAKAFCAKIGKETITVNEAPGFARRIWHPTPGCAVSPIGGR